MKLNRPIIRTILLAAAAFGACHAAPSSFAATPVPTAATQENGSVRFAPETVPQKTTGNPLWAVPLRLLSETRNRPIFSPTRRPPLVASVSGPVTLPPPPVPNTPAPPQLTLIGTVMGDSEAIGILYDQETKKVVRLKTEEMYLGWVLAEVRGREVLLRRNDEELLVAFPSPASALPRR